MEKQSLENVNEILLIASLKEAVKQVNILSEQLERNGFDVSFTTWFSYNNGSSNKHIIETITKKTIY